MLSCGPTRPACRSLARFWISPARFVKPRPSKSGLDPMRLAALLLLVLSGSALSQQQEIQRALIQRDQQSAEFAAQLRGGGELQQLETLHAAQLRDALVPM